MRSWWWTWWSDDRVEREQRQRRDEIQGLRSTLNGSVDGRIAALLLYGASDDALVASEAEKAIVAVMRDFPTAKLATLETNVRASSFGWINDDTFSPERIRNGVWGSDSVALLTFHRDGYVREAALRQLVRTATASARLPYCILRLNDWVREIRALAIAELDRAMAVEDPHVWVDSLGLVRALRQRSRGSHSDFVDAVLRRLARGDATDALKSALRSHERGVRRFATEIVPLVPEPGRRELWRMMSMDPDPATRTRALRGMLDSLQSSERDFVFEHFSRDPFAAVRQEVLYAQLDAPPQERESRLRVFLLDANDALARSAHFYLTKLAPNGFDARSFYLDELHRSRTPAAARGLGATGRSEDACQLIAWFGEPAASTAFRAAVVRAIAELARSSHVAWFESVLADARPRVAREAFRALLASRGEVSIERLRATLRTSRSSHTSRFALRLLLNRHVSDALPDAVEAAVHRDARTSEIAQRFVLSTLRSVRRFAPTVEQIIALDRALARVEARLTEGLAVRVRTWFV